MSDEPDPWSKDVPIAPAPTDFVFGDAAAAEPKRSASGPAVPAEPSDGRPAKNKGAARRRRIGLGAGLGVIAVGLIIATVLRDGTESATTADAPIESDGGSTVVEEPSATSAAPTPLDVPIKLNDGPTPIGSEVTAAGSDGDDDGGADSDGVGELASPSTWIDSQFVLPDRLRQIEPPAQLVVLTRRGLVVEIDIPSGTTSTLALDQVRYDGQLHIRDDAVLISSETGSSATAPTLLVSGQPAVEVSIPDRSQGYFIYDTGSNVGGFHVQTYDDTSGVSTQLSIGDDGVVTELAESGENFYLGEYAVATGERLRYDGGDIFLVTPPGQQPEQSRRISTGYLIGRSPGAIFVDECDKARACSYTLIDVESGERTVVLDEVWDRFSPNLQHVSMSPDGTAMLVTSGRAGESYFVELLTGGFVQLPFTIGSSYGTPKYAWSPDGSGIFTIDDGGIVFVDRFGTKLTPLPFDFLAQDTIVDIGVRAAPTT